jgi:hypothetical protein
LQQDIKDSIDTAKGIHKESSAKQVKKSLTRTLRTAALAAPSLCGAAR